MSIASWSERVVRLMRLLEGIVPIKPFIAQIIAHGAASGRIEASVAECFIETVSPKPVFHWPLELSGLGIDGPPAVGMLARTTWESPHL